MHNEGIAHRDIKPENILIDKTLNIKIADFGLAINKNISRSTDFVGTKVYMAPEIIERKPYDGVKADIFSVGVVLFAIVNAFMPFKNAKLSDKNYKMLVRGQKDKFFTGYEKVTGKQFSKDF